MNYIKRFNESSFNKEDFYWEIDTIDYDHDSTDSDIVDSIYNFLKEKSSFKLNYIHNGEIHISNDDDIEIWIISIKDDFYHVRYDDHTKPPYGYFYRCDGFDGLKRFLKDKNII
jgi:hypothetical protein